MRISELRSPRQRQAVWKFPLVLAVCAALVAFVVVTFLPKQYKSEATIYFPVQSDSTSNLASIASSIARAGIGSGLTADKNGSVSLAFGALSSPLIATAPQTAIALMDSNRCRQVIVDKLHLASRWKLTNQRALLRLDAITSQSLDKNGLLAIEVDENDPVLAKQIADLYIDELGKLSDELALTISKKNRQFLEGRVKASRLRMQQLERLLLQATVTDPNVAEMNAPDEAAQAIIDLESKLSTAQIALSGVNKQLRYTEDKARTALNAGTDLPATSELGKTQREKLAELEYQYALAKQELGPDNPQYRTLRDQLVSARALLKREIARESTALDTGIQPDILKLSVDKAGLEAQVTGLSRKFEEVKGRLASVPTRQLRRERLGYEIKGMRDLVANYEMDLAKARVAEDRDAITFQIVDAPEVADEPFAPRRLVTTALAGIAGMLVGVAFLITKGASRPESIELPERDVAVV